MISFRKPSADTIRSFLAVQAKLPYSYAEVGATRESLPAGFVVDHNRVKLGAGRAVFERAHAALRSWRMFPAGWVELCWPETPIEPGAVVAILARGCAAWWANACRIVYTVEETGNVEKYGFAYGTLPDHIGRGEERFQVEWRHEDDSVWYDILAFSQPHGFLARLGYPYLRHTQHRFAVESKRAMLRACEPPR